MGFVFNLLFIFVFLPLLCLLLCAWVITRKKKFGKALGCLLLGLIGLLSFVFLISTLTADKVLEKKDYYGQYVIDRNYFKGKQANWQYDNFRFEIKKDDRIYFYVTDKEKILKTYIGKISTLKTYKSEILVINMEKPTIHIMQSNPTIYRSAWSFYLVFHSNKFNNMYFRKGIWKRIDK